VVKEEYGDMEERGIIDPLTDIPEKEKALPPPMPEY